MADLIDFDITKSDDTYIKVVGVGGGGGNAVNHMFRHGIEGVGFAICNTDAQALKNSPVATKVQIGTHLSGGRGAGNKPDIGRKAAEENIDDIERVLGGGTKMVFITAGMGGGTGTGAAPVIASVARRLGLLTVGIVTIPFQNEGRKRKRQAAEGIDGIKSHVDSLLIIDNEKIKDIYGDFSLSEAFEKADEVLAVAAKGIAEVITGYGYINVDFEDVNTVLRDSGVSMMGSYTSRGKGRALQAVEGALRSPLLNDNNIFGASNILVNITSGGGQDEEVTLDEKNFIISYIQEKAGNNANLIHGVCVDSKMGDSLSVTVIVTGFEAAPILGKSESPPACDTSTGVLPSSSADTRSSMPPLSSPQHGANIGGLENSEASASSCSDAMAVDFSSKSDEYVESLNRTPAYKRKNGAVNKDNDLGDSDVSRITLSDMGSEGPKLRKDNPFLHDRAD